MADRIKLYLINVVLACTMACLVAQFFILCDKYTQNHYKTATAYNEMKSSEYQMQTEQFKMETARLNFECSEAKLKAFLKIYGGDQDER